MAFLFTNGIHQSDLVDLLVSIKNKWNAVMLKLDNDATLDDDDYVSANALTIPDGIQTFDPKAIRDQGQVVAFLQSMITQWNLVMAKLDADDLVGMDDDYASTLGLTDVVGDDSIDAILNQGIDQGAVINFLNRWITNWNLLLIKLDADPLAASDYVSSNGMTDTVQEGGSYARLRSIAIFILAGTGLLGLLASSPAGATSRLIQGDLFTYEFKHSSFTVDVNAENLNRFSIQVVYSTEVIPAVQFNGGGVSIVDNTLTVATNTIGAGMPVMLSTQGVAAPQPLVTGTTYFAVRVSDTLLKLATTYAQAISRDTIDILTNPGGAWTLVPRPLVIGSSAFSWFASNDGTNWIGAASVGSTVNGSTHSLTSMGAASTGTRLFDWGEFPYKFLRFTFSGPSLGAIKLRALINARTSD